MFSIIIPAYNEEKYIAKCLRSISLLKKPTDYEVIVVNNASTDRTAEIVRDVLPEAKIIEEPKKGLTRAYNRGTKEAKGDILVFVDADMILPQNHLERIIKEFERDPRLVALSGPYIYKDNGKFCEFLFRFIFLFLAMPAEIIFNRFLNVGASLGSGNSAIKKEAFEKVGGFSEELFYGLEADIALRLRKIGKVRFRHYLGTESSGRRLKKEGIFRMLFRYIINTVWPVFFKKPFTKNHIDVR
jgi:glycosyltransferase involved in cell wall biosynthesis